MTSKSLPLVEVAALAGRSVGTVQLAAERAGALRFFRRGKRGRLCVDRRWADAYLEEAGRCGDAEELLAAGYVTVEQAAEEAGVSAETIRRHLKRPTGAVGELFEGVRPVLVAGPQFGRGHLLNPHHVALVRERVERHRCIEREWVALRSVAAEFGMELDTVVEVAELLGVEVRVALATRVLAPTKFVSPAAAERLRGALRERLEVPEGALSLREAAEAWGVTREFLLATARRLGMELPQFRVRGSNVLGFFVPVEAQQALRAAVALPRVAPRSHVLVGDVSKELGVHAKRLLVLAGELGVKVEELRSRHALRTRLYVSRAGAARLREEVLGRRRPPRGALSIPEMAGALGVSEAVVRGVVEALGLQGRDGVRRDGSGFVRYYSREAVEAVRAECERRLPPPGLLSTAEVADALGISQRYAGDAIRRLGLRGVEAARRDGGGLARYYGRDALEAVRRHCEERLPPVGLLDILEVCAAAGVTRAQAVKALRDLGVRGREGMRRDGRGVASYYAPEAVEVVRGYFVERTPPAGYVGAEELGREAGVSRNYVARTAKRLGVKPAFGGGPGVKAYFSPEQRVVILVALGVGVVSEVRQAA